MYFVSNILLVVIFMALPDQISACNGYVFKFHHLKSCLDNSVIVWNNPGAILNKDCKMIPSGCMNTEAFKSAIIHYRVEKKPMPRLEGEFDMCKAFAEKNEYAMLLAGAIGLKTSCPTTKQTICNTGQNQINVAKYKSKLGLALGVSEVNVTITHDSGQSCMQLRVEFTKPRRMG